MSAFNRTDHAFHVWINQRQAERRAEGKTDTEHSLYEWKSAMAERVRVPLWLKMARTGTLPTAHQQCSHQAPELIPTNRVLCALGVDVTECPILKSLYATFREEAERGREQLARMRERWPDRTHDEAEWVITDEDADRIGGDVCAWHIFTTKHGGGDERQPYVDTSEGYVQDEGDRMYWRNVYDSLSDRDTDDAGGS